MSRNKKKSSLERIGLLDCAYWGGEEKGPLCVFFHGYGADCWDLVSLREELDIPDATWVFPNGILEVPIGPGWVGRAWTHIDPDKTTIHTTQSSHFDFSSIRPRGTDQALEASLSLFAALEVQNYSHLIVGGFSQGAILTVETLLSSQLPVTAAVLLSGTLMDESNGRSKIKLRSPVSFFQSHGTQDAILNFSGAQKLEQLLRQGGWQGYLRSFSGGHEIPSQIISQLKEYLFLKIGLKS